MFAWQKSLALLLCVLLILARGMGLHTHWSHDDHRAAASLPAAHASAHAQADHDHVHEHVHAVVNYAVDHDEAHLEHGDVDADEPGKAAGKLPSLTFVALLAVAAFLLLAQVRSAPRLFAPAPPLRPRCRTYFKPLSHAPPAAI